MNKKLKKMLAVVSAITMCAGSIISTCASAVAIFMDKSGKTYEEYTELGSNIVRTTTDNNSYAYYYKDGNILSPIVFYFNVYSNVEVEKAEKLSEFLSENYPSITVEYDISEGKNSALLNLDYNEELSFEKKLQIAVDIKKSVNLRCMILVLLSTVEITDIVKELPEPTLSGDTNCDNDVTIADAVLIMQNIANPDEYKITLQGMANTDVTGNDDGVTLSDAFVIQEMAASHLYD